MPLPQVCEFKAFRRALLSLGTIEASENNATMPLEYERSRHVEYSGPTGYAERLARPRPRSSTSARTPALLAHGIEPPAFRDVPPSVI